MKLSIKEFLEEAAKTPLTWGEMPSGNLRGQPVAPIPCPGADLHTTPTKPNDTFLVLPENGWPFARCLHASCRDFLRQWNRELRSAIEEAVVNREIRDFSMPSLSPEVRQQMHERAIIRQRVAAIREQVLSRPWTPEEMRAESPTKLAEDDDHGLALLSLFPRDAVVWLGEPHWTGRPYCAKNFRTVEEWFKFTGPWPQFTCPATFRRGTWSRSNDAVHSRPFVVVESDKLHKPQQGSIFRWCIDGGLRLRAIVDTGNKSLHGWFEAPDDASLATWAVTLEALGCDPATLRRSQPVRFPGAIRKSNQQKQQLLWIDLPE